MLRRPERGGEGGGGRLSMTTFGYAMRAPLGRRRVDPLPADTPDFRAAGVAAEQMRRVWAGMPGRDGWQVAALELEGECGREGHHEPAAVGAVIGLVGILGTSVVTFERCCQAAQARIWEADIMGRGWPIDVYAGMCGMWKMSTRRVWQMSEGVGCAWTTPPQCVGVVSTW